MQLSINIKDESKIDFLLTLLSEFKFVEILSSSNGSANGKLKNHTAPKQKKLTADQQKFVDGLREALEEVKLHRQGKIKLQSAREFLAEL